MSVLFVLIGVIVQLHKKCIISDCDPVLCYPWCLLFVLCIVDGVSCVSRSGRVMMVVQYCTLAKVMETQC